MQESAKQETLRRSQRKTSRARVGSIESEIELIGRFIPAIIAGGLLSACVIETDVTLFVSDVISIAAGGKSILTNATVAIEAGSKDNCAKIKDDTAAALKQGFETVEFVGCRDGAGFASSADFRVSLPIQMADTDISGAAAIWVANNGDTAMAVLKPNSAKIEAIRAALPPSLNSSFLPEPTLAIKVTVQNDTAGPATIQMFGAFIDGKPFQLPHDAVLERRDELAITLSDVGNAAMFNGGSILMSIKK